MKIKITLDQKTYFELLHYDGVTESRDRLFDALKNIITDKKNEIKIVEDRKFHTIDILPTKVVAKKEIKENGMMLAAVSDAEKLAEFIGNAVEITVGEQTLKFLP
jgi:hypothetical protein